MIKKMIKIPSLKIIFSFVVLFVISIVVFTQVDISNVEAISCAYYKESTGVAPAYTQYKTFISPTTGCEHSYLLALPEEYYANPAKKYPVLYWLPGSNHSQTNGAGEAKIIHDAITAGKIPPIVLVIAHSPSATHWVNAKSGLLPIETAIVQDLVSHVDASYRTIAQREARWLEGFSIGGRGVAHYALEYPELFGAYSSQAGGYMDYNFFSAEYSSVVSRMYGNDPEYFKLHDPIALVQKNVNAIKDRTVIRILLGTNDATGNTNPYGDIRFWTDKFVSTLAGLGIEYSYVLIQDVGHNYVQLITKMDTEGDRYKWYNDAYAKIPASSF